MSDDLHIPIVEEEAQVFKRSVETERVSVRTTTDEEQVLIQDELRHEHVDVTRVPVGREVAEAPAIRTEGDVTIVPVLEERLIVEKRLFLVEELHLRRTVAIDPVEVPTTLRRTRVEIERTELDQQEEH
ncbi:YsnF/AvaK domain-containing protein [Sphingomonas sp. PL-96]|uniref:YsnF/AvaK domain-containing protein n=1 Tax=Sphingomonas sp. PL-96 TaxID=2887201 RepID=UPI001E4CF3D6|nr:YsnF/AvaK domain-containing protein [Sphingomonas sp. PL-96]MCC2976619.1 YsnF/AvaK domain-containing protein [Sphingomonas sp. PL-96]